MIAGSGSVIADVIREGAMRFSNRRLLTVVAVVASACALPVGLHHSAGRGMRTVNSIRNTYRVNTAVYNLAHVARPSSGYYRVENGTAIFPDLIAWRGNSTPSWLSFLATSIQTYCFSPIRSANCDLDMVSDQAFSELMSIRSLDTVSIHGERCETIDINVLQARYPGINIKLSDSSFLQPIGTAADNDG